MPHTVESEHDEAASDFFIVTRERGTERDDLPVWATNKQNPLHLHDSITKPIVRQEVPGVPGAFQLLDVLRPEECERLLATVETLGFTQDAAVSLPRSVRHNSNLNWIVDDSTADIIWQRCQPHFTDKYDHFMGQKPLGINGRFRVYRYEEGDFFKTHTDGAWPGSKVIDGQLVGDAYGDRLSMYTFLVLLNDDFSGGETQFYVNKSDPSQPARKLADAEVVGIRTPAGGVLCFPHGRHPYHCLHASSPITQGNKYIITDVLFSLPT